MRIIQSLNQNAVIAVDNERRELILVGKGVGFNKKKGDLIDTERITKVYRYYYSNYERKLVESIKEIPENILLMAEDITYKASEILNDELIPSFLFTLASHLCFAIERADDLKNVDDLFVYELKYIYPKEYSVAEWAMNYLAETHQLNLADTETNFLTLHFVNGLKSTEQVKEVVSLSNILGDIIKILDIELTNIDKETFAFSRFILHLRYFILRKINENLEVNQDYFDLWEYVSQKYPQSHQIVEKISFMLVEKYDFDEIESEKLYLLLHIQRLIDEYKNNGEEL